jgi:predicted DNA binding CopG/RHH family protein
MTMNKKLPDFKTPEEFAEFVENHDMGDYWEEFEDVDVTIKRPPKQKITMWIHPRLLQDVKKIAVQYGISHQTLLQQWIAEKGMAEKRRWHLRKYKFFLLTFGFIMV